MLANPIITPTITPIPRRDLCILHRIRASRVADPHGRTPQICEIGGLAETGPGGLEGGGSGAGLVGLLEEGALLGALGELTVAVDEDVLLGGDEGGEEWGEEEEEGCSQHCCGSVDQNPTRKRAGRGCLHKWLVCWQIVRSEGAEDLLFSPGGVI